MRLHRWAVLALIPALALGVLAQEGMRVERAAVAPSVEDREPVGEAASFPADVGSLSCYSKIVGAGEETEIFHVWRHGPTERAKVRLTVRGSSWRTWSTKRILPTWTGPWTVEIQDAQENVLATVAFTIEGPGTDE
jgi:hypothetical protein